MATTTATRRLAAILAADVVGYSRVMGADEEGTHERFKAHLVELIDPKIREHHGRIVKTTGDGVLAEFASVVDAVRCAAEIQHAMADRDLDLAEERRLRFRVGVNLGDVIVDDGDIYGDGVNIAVRLEGLAAPGGICVSGTVRDHIGDRLPYAFEDKGEQSVKNIARPVRTYVLRPESVSDLSDRRLTARPSRRHRAMIGVVAAAALLVVVCFWWWLWRAANSSPTLSVAAATAISPALIAPRLSIVVLPFVNLSNDPEQQYLADGITEDLTTDLSRISHMFVISRNTAFSYTDKSVKAKQIGREVGARYVLEGSVQRSGNQVRISAQLIDAETESHLWAERFDRDMGDLFALQDDITRLIAYTLNLKLIRAEAARPTEHPDALDYILRARAAISKPQTRDSYAESVKLFEAALTLNPRSVEAKSGLAYALAGRVLDGLSPSRVADIQRAEELISEALANSPGSLFLHLAKGEVMRAKRQCAEAIPEYETVIAFDGNSKGAYAGLGRCKFFTGSLEEAAPLLEQAIRLSPRDPRISNDYSRIGVVRLLQSHTDEAIDWFERARGANAGVPYYHAYLAAAYGLRGDLDRAASELAEARRLSNSDRYSSITRLRDAGYYGVPEIRSLFEATYFAGLRKAGMPEE